MYVIIRHESASFLLNKAARSNDILKRFGSRGSSGSLYSLQFFRIQKLVQSPQHISKRKVFCESNCYKFSLKKVGNKNHSVLGKVDIIYLIFKKHQT